MRIDHIFPPPWKIVTQVTSYIVDANSKIVLHVSDLRTTEDRELVAEYIVRCVNYATGELKTKKGKEE